MILYFSNKKLDREHFVVPFMMMHNEIKKNVFTKSV